VLQEEHIVFIVFDLEDSFHGSVLFF